MKPESQTRLSAVTAVEKDNQPASTLARAERAGRLRDYFDLQLRFAEAVAATAALPLSEAVAQCTNFTDDLDSDACKAHPSHRSGTSILHK